MTKLQAASSCFLSYLLVQFVSSVSAITDDPQDRQVYIVYMGAFPSRADYTPMSDHMRILKEITGESSIEGRLVRSYTKSFNGFAARLTEIEQGIVSVFSDEMLQLHTTASWDFMGLKQGKSTKRNLAIESDNIIGVIDTGITYAGISKLFRRKIWSSPGEMERCLFRRPQLHLQ